ncbi:MAG: hypothetical protein OXD45_06210 [Rhodobacteraceae bacterium]|nr:hypothetical protein [Paracoccaceae bacterium]MCY4309249.1 hypothetical protein [Paracoccaceae bacterium]
MNGILPKEDKELSDNDKIAVHKMVKTRFKHRKIMAYISLFGIIVFGILEIFTNIDVTEWIYGSFATIVMVYYGTSAWKPNS